MLIAADSVYNNISFSYLSTPTMSLFGCLHILQQCDWQICRPLTRTIQKKPTLKSEGCVSFFLRNYSTRLTTFILRPAKCRVIEETPCLRTEGIVCTACSWDCDEWRWSNDWIMTIRRKPNKCGKSCSIRISSTTYLARSHSGLSPGFHSA